MFPVMEIFGYEHVKFIDVILYQYRLHKNNDQFSKGAEQYRGEMIIRNQQKLNNVW